MFISDDEFLIAGTDLGYISAKRNEKGKWELSLPPKHAEHVCVKDFIHPTDPEKSINHRCLACRADQLKGVLKDLERGKKVEIVPVRGNIQNLASGRTLADVRERTLKQINERGGRKA